MSESNCAHIWVFNFLGFNLTSVWFSVVHFSTMPPSMVYTWLNVFELSASPEQQCKVKPHYNIILPFLFKFCYDLSTRWDLIYNGDTEPSIECDRVQWLLFEFKNIFKLFEYLRNAALSCRHRLGKMHRISWKTWKVKHGIQDFLM